MRRDCFGGDGRGVTIVCQISCCPLRVDFFISTGVSMGTLLCRTTMCLRIHFRNGTKRLVSPYFADLAAIRFHAPDGVRKGETSRDAMRDMGVMDADVVISVSDLGVLAGSRGMVGVASRAPCNSWRVWGDTWKGSSKCVSTFMGVGIWLLQMSWANLRILLSLGVGWQRTVP